jgi:hypothetical protein
VRDRGDVGTKEKIRFTSAILPKWARRTKSLDALLADRVDYTLGCEIRTKLVVSLYGHPSTAIVSCGPCGVHQTDDVARR